MPDPAVLHVDETFVLARDGRLFATFWWDAPRLEQLERVHREGVPFDAANGGKTAFVQFILAGTPRFTAEVRDAAANIARSRLFRLGNANVIEVGGLKGVATRAFLNTVILVGGGAKRMRVFAEPDAAARWLVDLLDPLDPGAWTSARVLELRATAVAAYEGAR